MLPVLLPTPKPEPTLLDAALASPPLTDSGAQGS